MEKKIFIMNLVLVVFSQQRHVASKTIKITAWIHLFIGTNLGKPYRSIIIIILQNNSFSNKNILYYDSQKSFNKVLLIDIWEYFIWKHLLGQKWGRHYEWHNTENLLSFGSYLFSLNFHLKKKSLLQVNAIFSLFFGHISPK